MDNAPAASKKTILIVDDDQYNRDFYQELLQDNGFAVDTAENGDVAITKLQEKPHFDLILLDIVMPVKDGMETLTTLQDRRDLTQKHGPIYMLSALGQESVLMNAQKLGAKGFIVKTDVSPEQFMHKINEILPPSV